MQKRWTVKRYQHKAEQALQNALKVHPLLCRLLVQRGVTTFDQARLFFRPTLADLHDPWLMKDMDKAIARIADAIHHGEKILVYGDYDVDGTTAVATVYAFLQDFYKNIEFYVPHRYREGYGISLTGVEYARENDFSLVIALDCGIKSVELITYAKEHGIDFIICDHHLPDAILPPAVAILNPKQDDCHYPYKELSGCGIGFKLICAMAQRRQMPMEKAYAYLDLVATSIAADIVPMTGENRVLTFHGLVKVNTNPLPGIKALIELSKLKDKLTIANLVFVIAPRVNAAGRMDDARKAVNLFIETDEAAAEAIAAQLHADNDDRKAQDDSVTREAVALIQDEIILQKKSTVLYQPHWHKGVVGIVASRLIDKYYYRPTIILTQSNDKVAGSARSVSGFNVYEAIHQCKDLLENYGGHFYAAGMTLKPENVEAFRQRFEEVVSSSIDPDLLTPEILIDTELNFSDITPKFFNILDQFEPLGPDNLRAVFMARQVFDTGYSRIVKDEHIKFSVRQGRNGVVLSGIGFFMAEKFPCISTTRPFDMVFTVEKNEWQGNTSLQLKVIDIRPSR